MMYSSKREFKRTLKTGGYHHKCFKLFKLLISFIYSFYNTVYEASVENKAHYKTAKQ